RERKLALLDGGAEPGAEIDRAADGVFHSRLDALALVQLARHADAEARDVLRLGNLDRGRQLDGRRVARVAGGNDPGDARTSAPRPRQGADRVEARGEGDDPEARDGAVGRAQADDPAERGRLLDRAAGVGAERPRSEAAGDCGGRAARGTAGDALEVP